MIGLIKLLGKACGMRCRKLSMVLSALVLGLLAGCKSSHDVGADSGGTGGSSEPMTYMIGDYEVVPRETCPDSRGMDAQQGPCCYRNVPNSVRFENAPDGMVELEYRLNWQFTINHPDSLSLELLKGLARTRNENEEQSLLFRFKLPKKNGKLVAGPGELTIGQGRYNCDGTYSFYKDAAPVLTAPEDMFPNSDDKSRWNETVTPIMFDPSKSGRDAWQINFEDRYTGKSYSPFMDDFDPTNLFYDWEIVTENVDIESWPDLTPDSMDCAGHRDDVGEWFAEGYAFSVFTRLDDNSLGDNGINQLSNMTYAQLVAIGPDAASDYPDPNTMERCEPGTADCRWVKLPDSLCPDNDDERALFACHLGDVNNADGRTAKCSADPPTTPRTDTTEDEGQCCDPLGDAASGLPTCNAYFVDNELVAASAQITDKPSSKLVEACKN